MKIATIGWSGNKNQGDERMQYCIERYFRGNKIVNFNGFLEAIENLEKLNSCDYILIGAGGLINRGFNRYIDFLSNIQKPFGCIGISIETNKLNADMQDGLEVIKNRADFIYVRDKKSKELFDNHYKVIVGPDISFLYPYPIIQKVNQEICALNLRNWFWWDFELYGYSHEFFTKVEKRFSRFRYFYPLKKWNPDNLVDILKKEFVRFNPLPLYFGKYDKTDYEILSKYFNKIDHRFNLDNLSSSKYLIGMRLHSLMFACQMGIPFISLSYEPKNINFCNEIGIPHLSINLKDYKNIRENITYIKKNYKNIRTKLINYTINSKNEAEYIFKKIEKLIVNKIT